MPRKRRLFHLLMTGAALAASGTGRAVAQEAAVVDSAAAPADTARKPLGDLPIFITGYVTTSYTYDFGNTGDRITGRFYDRFHDTFVPNALRLGIEKVAATDALDVGVRFELLFGTDAQVTQALVDGGTFNLGDYGDLTEAYVTLNVPLGTKPDHYVQFKAGKMWTIMGYEVIDDVLDPNLSVGNQFTYLENFTNVGAGADFKFGPKFDAQFRVINGWDVVQDNNTDKSFMLRLGWNPSSAFTLGVLGYYGPEQADNTDDSRQGVDVVATYKGLAKTTLVAQFDYGTEDFGGGTTEASWWGVGAWLIRDLGVTTQLALRGDYVDDKDGARTSGVFGFAPAAERQFGNVTATLNWRVLPKVMIRPEVRFDYSSEDDYGDLDDPQSTNTSIGVGFSYQF